MESDESKLLECPVEDAAAEMGTLLRQGKSCLHAGAYDAAMNIFAHCHQLALKTQDDAGAYVSLVSLKESIASSSVDLDCIWVKLVAALQQGGGCGEEKGEAWAAFYVGFTAVVDLHRVWDGLRYLDECYELATANLLKFHVTQTLGMIYESAPEVLNYDRAVSLYRECEQTAYRLGKRRADLQAIALFNLCLCLCQVNDFQEARLKQIHLKDLANEDPVFAGALDAKIEASLRIRVSQFLEAKSANAEVIRLLEQLPSDLDEHCERYSLEPSTYYCSHSMEKMFMASHCLTRAWYETGRLQYQLGDPVAASETYQTTLEKAKRMGSPGMDVYRIRCLGGLAYAYLQQQKLEEAEDCAAQMLSLSDDRQESIEVANALQLLALITVNYRIENFDEEAFEIGDSFLAEAEVINRSNPRSLRNLRIVLYWQGIFSQSLLKLDQAINKFKECLLCFVEEEGKVGHVKTGRISNLEHEKEAFRLLQDCLLMSEPPQVKQALIWAERERARDLLRETNGGLYGDDELFSFDTDDDKAWEEIQQICDLAGEDSLFLLFTQCDDDTVISYLLHAQDEPKAWKDSITDGTSVIPIFSMVQELIHQIRKDSSEELLRMFYRLLIRPWEGDLERISPRRVILVPTEELSMLPFSALLSPAKQDDEDGQYLIQRYAISYSSSVRLFKQCELRRQDLDRRGDKRSALVVGNPTLPEQISLPSAQEEAIIITEMFRESTNFQSLIFLQNEQATKESILELLPCSDWVHIASHAIVNEDFPNGALLLSSKVDSNSGMEESMEKLNCDTNYVTTRAQFYSGRMESDEVERALLTFTQSPMKEGWLSGDMVEAKAPLNARVVVLSACSTGLGQICAEGILGLARSLHLSGVPTVVVSLWNVNDVSTKELMTKFYENLCNDMDIATSFQEAIKFIINQEDEFWGERKYNVRHWASFLISGSMSCKLAPN